MRCLWLAAATVLSLFQLASASLVNITVDDTTPSNQGVIIYQPSNGWLQGGIGGCNGCQSPTLPNVTYHGSLFNPQKDRNPHQTQTQNPPTATLAFIGTSVTVDCFLSNSLNPPGTADLTFLVDGIQLKTYSHSASGSPELERVTVFSSGPLSSGNHNLVIQNGRPDGGTSMILLDSITYSFEDLSNSSSSTESEPVTTQTASPSAVASLSAAKTSNTAAIAGGVIAALAVILLLALAFLYIRHRRNQHRSNVPLSTSILSPFRRIGGLFSADPAKPPPDMAPVPFPSPEYRVSQPRSSRPPAPAPASPPGSRISRISFNANLLVGRFQRRPPPSAIVTQQAPNTNTRLAVPVPASPALPSGNPLLRPPSAQPDPDSRVASIQMWQRRTQEEMANEPIPIIHPLDMSEVDLSSHYDESTLSSPPPQPPAPPPPRTPQAPQRRFTVMNN